MGQFDKVSGKATGAIKLSKPEAFTAVAAGIIASDGNISQKEIQRTVTNLTAIKFFRDYDLGDLNNTLNKVAGLLRDRGSSPVIQAVKETLNKELRETAFFIAADLALSDGLVEVEKVHLKELQDILRVDESTASQIMNVAIIKNRV